MDKVYGGNSEIIYFHRSETEAKAILFALCYDYFVNQRRKFKEGNIGRCL